jgi:hypothetical protein
MDDVSDTPHYKASDSSKIGRNVSIGKQLSISSSNVMAVHASLPLHGQNKTQVSSQYIGAKKPSTRTEELIREPAQRVARHVRNHPWRETPRKPAQPVSSPNDFKCI